MTVTTKNVRLIVIATMLSGNSLFGHQVGSAEATLDIDSCEYSADGIADIGLDYRVLNFLSQIR